MCVWGRREWLFLTMIREAVHVKITLKDTLSEVSGDSIQKEPQVQKQWNGSMCRLVRKQQEDHRMNGVGKQTLGVTRDDLIQPKYEHKPFHSICRQKNVLTELRWWLSGKEPTCQCRRHRLDPWVVKIPWTRKWQPTPVFLPGKSHGQRSLVGYLACYSPWDHKESDMSLLLNNNSQGILKHCENVWSSVKNWTCFYFPPFFF